MLLAKIQQLFRHYQLNWRAYEHSAAKYLRRQGIKIITRNFKGKPQLGEIDIIGLELSSQTIIFVEVRQRSNPQWLSAQQSISKDKQRKLTRTAHQFLSQQPKYQQYFCRFDAIIFNTNNLQQLEWLKDAFQK